MIIAVTHSYNIWFIESQATGQGPVVAAVKQAMIEDGYWEDCEMEDGEIEDNSMFAIYPIADDQAATKIQKAYKSIRVNNEDEMFGVIESFKAIMTQFK